MTNTKRLVVLLFLSTLTAGAFAAPPPRVAVFSQPGFQYYGPTVHLAPKQIAADLRVAGLSADELDADALADPARFNARTYAAVVLPYGNDYPQAAFPNLRTFHRAGGCLVLTGIPFTHPLARDAGGGWQDLGHNPAPALFGPDGIGVGGFHTGLAGAVSVAAGDRLVLTSLTSPGTGWGRGEDAQALDPATLPAGAQIAPILTAGGQPVAALVRHVGDAFDGAVDVWTVNALRGDDLLRSLVNRQMLARGTVAALAWKGTLDRNAAMADLKALNSLPRPRVYANVTLPRPPRPYPTLQPKMPPPARHLYVADVRHLSSEERLLLASLQGLVNRSRPRIYLVSDDTDPFWLNVLQQQGSTDAPIPVADPLSLLQTFKAAYKGVVVPDPNVYVTPCVAVDVAGADDLLIATPALAARFGLPIKSDLRGKFKDDADALRYARTTLLPRLNPYLALCLDPPLLGSQVDDVIAAKGMCFWVTGPEAQDRPGADGPAEREEIQATLAQMPLEAVVRGYWWHGDDMGLGENGGVALGSQFGKITTVSDYVSNYSVFSGVVLPALKQKPQPPAPKLDPTKVYVAITMSDGDNLITWRDFWRGYFTDPLHGTFPLAYGIGPTLIDVAPTMARWYYDHAAPTDEFICDVSGAGYVYPTDWGAALKDRPAAYADYYGWTQKYMDRLDLHGLRIMGTETEDIRDAISRTGAALPGVPFLLPDYGPRGDRTYAAATYTLPTGQPVFRAVSYGGSAQNLAAAVRDRVGAVRPAFVNAFVQNWGARPSDLKGMLDALGPDYIAVTPSQLNALYRQAARKAPRAP